MFFSCSHICSNLSSVLLSLFLICKTPPCYLVDLHSWIQNCSESEYLTSSWLRNTLGLSVQMIGSLLPNFFWHTVSWTFQQTQLRCVLTDYRFEDRKTVGELRDEIRAIRKPTHHPQNELFSQEIHLKIPLSSRGLILSISKPGCRVSALHFFCKIDSTNGLQTWSSFK